MGSINALPSLVVVPKPRCKCKCIVLTVTPCYAATCKIYRKPRMSHCSQCEIDRRYARLVFGLAQSLLYEVRSRRHPKFTQNIELGFRDRTRGFVSGEKARFLIISTLGPGALQLIFRAWLVILTLSANRTPSLTVRRQVTAVWIVLTTIVSGSVHVLGDAITGLFALLY